MKRALYARSPWQSRVGVGRAGAGELGEAGMRNPRARRVRNKAMVRSSGAAAGNAFDDLGDRFPGTQRLVLQQDGGQGGLQAVNGSREEPPKIGGAAKPEDTELCLRLSHACGTSGQ